MTKDLYDKVKDYRTAMSVINEMLGLGIITIEEFSIIDTILTEKYGLKSCTIFH